MDGFALIDGLFKSFITMIGTLAWPGGALYHWSRVSSLQG
jgi:hypothetical protein